MPFKRERDHVIGQPAGLDLLGVEHRYADNKEEIIEYL